MLNVQNPYVVLGLLSVVSSADDEKRLIEDLRDEKVCLVEIRLWTVAFSYGLGMNLLMHSLIRHSTCRHSLLRN